MTWTKKRGLHQPVTNAIAAHLHAEWRDRRLHTDTAYMSRFIRRRCATDLLALDLFRGSAKEVTESEAMREAAARYLDLDPRDSDVMVIVPGDGGTPRTGALLAFTTRWEVVSVDPDLRRWCDANVASGSCTAWSCRPATIRRLTVVPHRVEDAAGRVLVEPPSKVAVLACHSHASLDASLDVVCASYPRSQIRVAAMGCCFEQTITGRVHDAEYIDDGVASPHRVVRIWKAAGAT